MQVLALLFNLAVLVFALAICVVALYWAGAIGYFAIGGILYLLWLYLFAFAGVIGAAISWYQGYDNFAVLLVIAALIGQGVWWKMGQKNNPVLRAHKGISAEYTTIENTIKDVLKGLRLRKPDPREECPKCGSRNIKLVKERTSTYESTGTFTRTIKHYSEDGTETGHSEEEYEAPTSDTTWYRDIACVQCSHTWTTR